MSGSIAAYKAADLASRLTQAGLAVETVMTEAARQLVTEHTFHAVTGRPVHTRLFDPAEAASVAHIDITDRAAVLVIAPATANVIGRLALGLADDVLTTMALAVRCPVIVCPAMNHRMWSHPAVQKNLETLRGFGYRIIEPDAGHLACGHTGPGRLAEPEAIAEVVRQVLDSPAASVRPERGSEATESKGRQAG